MAVKNPSFFQDTAEQRTTDQTGRALDALALTVTGAAIEERLLTANKINLTAGTFPFFAQKKAETSIAGSNSLIAGMRATARCTVSDVRFTDTVTITSTGNVTYVNCRFDTQVVVEAGGKAAFTNCHFVANVSNAGGPANVGIIGCYRAGAVHVNCTIIFEQVP